MNRFGSSRRDHPGLSCLLRVGGAGLLLLFLLLITPAQAQVRLDKGVEQVLNCFVGDSLPKKPQTAEQGGYRLQYQAFSGVTDDNRVCSVYNVRNTPGKPPTPVKWVRDSEAFIEEMRLARCAEAATACEWVRIAKYFDGSLAQNASNISYGLNADSFHEAVETFSTTLSPDESRGFNAVGTEIQGSFATVNGDAVPLHLIIKSVITTKASGERQAIFEITDLASADGANFADLYLRWGALNVSRGASAFLQRLPGSGLRGLSLSAKPQAGVSGRLERIGNRLAIVTPIGDYALRRDFRLLIYHRGTGPEPLVAVPMPAFLPPN